MNTTIEQLRKEIEQIDASLIEILAIRQELCKQIGQLKLNDGREIVDLSREEALFEFYKNLSKKHNLQHHFIEKLFKLIISYSRKVQEL